MKDKTLPILAVIVIVFVVLFAIKKDSNPDLLYVGLGIMLLVVGAMKMKTKKGSGLSSFRVGPAVTALGFWVGVGLLLGRFAPQSVRALSADWMMMGFVALVIVGTVVFFGTRTEPKKQMTGGDLTLLIAGIVIMAIIGGVGYGLIAVIKTVSKTPRSTENVSSPERPRPSTTPLDESWFLEKEEKISVSNDWSVVQIPWGVNLAFERVDKGKAMWLRSGDEPARLIQPYQAVGSLKNGDKLGFKSATTEPLELWIRFYVRR